MDRKTQEGDIELDEQSKYEEQTKEIFSKMSSHYNTTTVLLTFGLILKIQNYMLKKTDMKIGDQVIDVCCGTGELSFKIAKAIRLQGDVVGVDFSKEMLDVGRAKAIKENIKNVEFVEANALDLPFEDNKFDIAINSFSLRNIVSIKEAIAEMARVVDSKGQVVCLEAAIPTNKILSLGFKLVIFQIVPIFAGIINLIKRDKKFFDHAWLIESFKQFPNKKEIIQMYTDAGLVDLEHISIIGGLFNIYLGKKK